MLAGLALQDRLRTPYTDPVTQHEVAFDVCLGVHTGPVMAGTDTSDPQRPAMVVGEVMRVVAQLQYRAGQGMLLSSEDTLHLVPGQVYCEVYDTVVIPGRSTPLRTYTVQAIGPGRVSAVLRTARTLSRFVGREREMAMLHALLAHAVQGRGQVVDIAGEPGMGKSRVLEEFRCILAGTPVTYGTGHCLSYGHTTPYLPVLDLLRQLCGITNADPSPVVIAQVRQQLGEVGPRPGGGGTVSAAPVGYHGGDRTRHGAEPEGVQGMDVCQLAAVQPAV